VGLALRLKPVLKCQTAAHDDISRHEDEYPAHNGALGTSEPGEIAEEADDDPAEHLSGPVERRVEGPTSESEREAWIRY
jgi:hypothetical protein